MAAVTTGQLFNFLQGSDISGESSYDIWKSTIAEGGDDSYAAFLEFIRSGQPGENATVYILDASTQVIKKKTDGELLPASVTFTSVYRAGTDAVRNSYPCRFIIEESVDGNVWETKYTSTTDEAEKVYTPSNTAALIKCTQYSAGGTTNALDNQTIVVLADIDSIEVGARNLLSMSDIKYEFTKDSTGAVISRVDLVDGFDLQRLINKKIVLSYYVDTQGVYVASDDGQQTTSDCFGAQIVITWSNGSTTATQTIDALKSVGIVKERIGALYEVIAPDGYTNIEEVYLNVYLSLKPGTANDLTWTFARPKLEIGNIATDWTLAPEDTENVVVTLSNEAHNIATDKNGDNGDYTGCETYVQAYSGPRNVSDMATYTVTASEGVTGTWDNTIYKYTVTGLSTDTGYVDIQATYNGAISIVKRFTISKVKAGAAGQSTYEIWSSLGNTGDAQDFLDSLKGDEGKSAYDAWVDLGNEGTVQDFLEYIRGKSAYEIWLAQDGNAGKTEEDFLKSVAPQADWNQTDNTAQDYIKNKPTSMPASDVADWAKADTKPTYTASEVGSDPAGSADDALSDAKSYTNTKISELAAGVAYLNIQGSADVVIA